MWVKYTYYDDQKNSEEQQAKTKPGNHSHFTEKLK